MTTQIRAGFERRNHDFALSSARDLAQHNQPPKAHYKQSNRPDFNDNAVQLHPWSGKHSDQNDTHISRYSGDHFTTQYIYFLASLESASDVGLDGYQERVAEIEQSLADPQAAGEGGEVSSEISASILSSAMLSISGQNMGRESIFQVELDFRFEGYLSVSAEFADGTKLDNHVSVDVQVSVQVSAVQGQTMQSDPLAIDLDGDGEIALTDAANGLQFDLNGDGRVDQAAFVTGNDIFLALDRNKNGVIDDGSELFGDQHGEANGFLELAKFDKNRDGKIDIQDSVFSELQGVRLGLDNALHAYSLASMGVQSISLNYQDVQEIAQGGNQIAQTGSYTNTQGVEHRMADVLLNYY